MAVDEVRVRLRRKLEELVGVEEADLLMDRPPGGWNDLVGRLDGQSYRFDAIDQRFIGLDHRFDEIDQRFIGLDHQFTGLDHQFTGLDHRLDAVNERLEGQSYRFDAIDAKIDAVRHELVGTMHLEFRNQTWKMMAALFGAVGALAAIVGAVVAAIQL